MKGVRALFRYNGVDNDRGLEAYNKLRDAIEEVKLFDGGNYDI